MGYSGTDTLHTRLETLQVASPYELKVLWVYNGRDYSEADLHNLFKHEHIRGEWFRPGRKLLSFRSEHAKDCYPLTNLGMHTCRTDIECINAERRL